MSDRQLLTGGAFGALLGAGIGFVVGKLLSTRRRARLVNRHILLSQRSFRRLGGRGRF